MDTGVNDDSKTYREDSNLLYNKNDTEFADGNDKMKENFMIEILEGCLRNNDVHYDSKKFLALDINLINYLDIIPKLKIKVILNLQD